MAGTGSGDLFALANTVLDVCHNAGADTVGGLIDCYFVSEGVPAWDFAPMLTVHVGGPAVADTLPLQPSLAPLHRIAVQGQVNLISLTATVLRCAPNFGNDGGATLPSPAEHDAVAMQTLSDLWSIWNHLKKAKLDGLFGPKEREFGLDPALSLVTAGGICGWQIGCRIELDGYAPVIG